MHLIKEIVAIGLLILVTIQESSCAPFTKPKSHERAIIPHEDELRSQLQLQQQQQPQSEKDASEYTIPTRYQSTVLGRRLLALSSTGSIATVFPTNTSYPRTPNDVSTIPIALPDYLASCEEPSGNPTILALKISTATRNAAAGSNVSLSLSWWDEYSKITHREPWSQANLPRLSMLGYMEEMEAEVIKERDVAGCFTKMHPDSALWLPGKQGAAHEGVWMRLVVQEIYWIGGFGDRNFIGWFDPDDWRNVKIEEWSQVRLPGEI